MLQDFTSRNLNLLAPPEPRGSVYATRRFSRPTGSPRPLCHSSVFTEYMLVEYTKKHSKTAAFDVPDQGARLGHSTFTMFRWTGLPLLYVANTCWSNVLKNIQDRRIRCTRPGCLAKALHLHYVPVDRSATPLNLSKTFLVECSKNILRPPHSTCSTRAPG